MRLNMMRSLSPKLILLLAMLFACLGVTSSAQDDQSNRSQRQFDNPQPDRRDMLRALGLTPEQVQQIRRMNQARKPQMDVAAMRLRMANRALDEAIYADTVDDAVFQARLKDLQLAQAEMARLRFTSELGVRKILTPEQLGRFREMRRRFAPPPADRQMPRGIDDKNPVPQRVLKRVP